MSFLYIDEAGDLKFNRDSSVETISTSPEEAVAFAAPVTVAGQRKYTFSGGGVCIISLASSGHEEGGWFQLFIPANAASSIISASDLNTASWDTWTSTNDYLITVLYTSNQFISSGRDLGLRDSTAPTINSAVVDNDNPDALVLGLSEAAYLPNLTGLSLNFTSGTARTLTAIESGNGTNTVTLTLSGNLADGDALNLVIGSSRTLQDLNGNLIAAGSQAVSVNGFGYEMPGQLHMYRGDMMSTSGSDVLQVNDQVSTVHVTPAASPRPQLVTSGGHNGWKFVTSGAYLKGDRASTADLSTGSIMIVGRTSNTEANYEAFLALGKSTLVDTEIHILNFGSLATMLSRRDGAGVGDLQTAGPGNSIHSMLFTWDTSEAIVYIDDVSVGSSSVDVTAEPIQRIALGILANLSSSPSHGHEQYEVRIGNQKLVGAQVTDLFNYCQGRYGTP